MGTDQIMYCIVALILGMLLANMLKNVCGCKTVEGKWAPTHGPVPGKCGKCVRHSDQATLQTDMSVSDPRWLNHCRKVGTCYDCVTNPNTKKLECIKELSPHKKK